MTRKQIKDAAARYFKFVEWSDEDKVFIGRCPGLFLGGIHGTDEAKVYKELVEAVEENIELFNQDGKPLPVDTYRKQFSGKFVVRIEPELHRRLAAKAEIEGQSLNHYVKSKLVTV